MSGLSTASLAGSRLYSLNNYTARHCFSSDAKTIWTFVELRGRNHSVDKTFRGNIYYTFLEVIFVIELTVAGARAELLSSRLSY